MIPWLLNLVRVPLPALTLLNWLVAIVFAICYSFCVLSLTVCDSYNKTWRSVIARWQKRKKRSKCKDPHVFKSMRPDSTKLWETSSQMLWVLTRPSHCGECFKIWVLSTFYSSSFSFSQVKFTPRGGVVTVGISCKMLEPSETYRSRAKVLGFEGILVGSSRYLDNNLRPRLSIILWVYWEWKCRTLERDLQQRNKARCLENSYSSIGKSFKAEVEVPLWERLWFIGECLPVLGSGGSGLGLWISRRIVDMHKVFVFFSLWSPLHLVYLSLYWVGLLRVVWVCRLAVAVLVPHSTLSCLCMLQVEAISCSPSLVAATELEHREFLRIEYFRALRFLRTLLPRDL